MLLTSSNQPSARFLGADNHPAGTDESRPDFRLRCDTLDIICEHKLGSPLGPRQLERYLALPYADPFCVALITAVPCVVSAEVLSADRYLRPRQSQLMHFRWQDLYPLVAARPERLARDFAAYMRDLDLHPWQQAGWNDLFTSSTTATAWSEQWSDVRAFFGQQGIRTRRDEDHLGLQVMYPRSWLHLLYFDVNRTITPSEPRIDGPYVRAQVYVRADDPATALSHCASRVCDTPLGVIAKRPRHVVMPWPQPTMLVQEVVIEMGSARSSKTAGFQS